MGLFKGASSLSLASTVSPAESSCQRGLLAVPTRDFRLNKQTHCFNPENYVVFLRSNLTENQTQYDCTLRYLTVAESVITVMNNVTIRRVRTSDTEFILNLLPSLADPELPHWRDPAAMLDIDKKILKAEIEEGGRESAIFVAEDAETKEPLGFIYLEVGTDYYHPAPHGHIADVIVAPAARGRGIGKLLMKKAEEWTKESGYSLLTLNVFNDNEKARNLYSSLGFKPDMTKYGKVL